MWPLYQHYKGNFYLSFGASLHSETTEPLAVYRSLYNNPLSLGWVRPKEMFFDAGPTGEGRFRSVGTLLRAYPEDMTQIHAFGFDAWGEGRTLQEFIAYYGATATDTNGEWYLLENTTGDRVAKMRVRRLARNIVGLASIATHPEHRRRGYGSLITRAVMGLVRAEAAETRFLLFSEVGPSMYEQLGFQVAPDVLQHFMPAVAMATGQFPLSAEEGQFLREYF